MGIFSSPWKPLDSLRSTVEAWLSYLLFLAEPRSSSALCIKSFQDFKLGKWYVCVSWYSCSCHATLEMPEADKRNSPFDTTSFVFSSYCSFYFTSVMHGLSGRAWASVCVCPLPPLRSCLVLTLRCLCLHFSVIFVSDNPSECSRWKFFPCIMKELCSTVPQKRMLTPRDEITSSGDARR